MVSLIGSKSLEGFSQEVEDSFEGYDCLQRFSVSPDSRLIFDNGSTYYFPNITDLEMLRVRLRDIKDDTNGANLAQSSFSYEFRQKVMT